ncbi:hypothetical protein DL98DRAFT_532317 [Cadophora sp. DSE1049]|nr:hypothetical protein DL98DRAFT_532317 [Cadophora sp. DSE1049]
MCLTQGIYYDQCMHIVTILHHCGNVRDDCPLREVQTAYDIFCEDCFLLPDPRDSPFHVTEDGERYTGPACPRFLFDEFRQETARRLWAQARDHMHDHPNDLYVFVDAERDVKEPLPDLARRMLGGIHLILMCDFWMRLDTENPCTLSEKTLILQLQLASEYNHYKQEFFAITEPEKQPRERKDVIADALIGASLEDTKDDDQCSICMTRFITDSEDGSIEFPVKVKRCGHIFGAECIKTWLETRSNCPVCRAEVLRYENHELYSDMQLLYDRFLSEYSDGEGDDDFEDDLEDDPEDGPHGDLHGAFEDLIDAFEDFIHAFENHDENFEDYIEENTENEDRMDLDSEPHSDPSVDQNDSVASESAFVEEDEEYEEDSLAMPLWMRVLLNARAKRDCDFLFMGLTEAQMMFMFRHRCRPERREQPGEQLPYLRSMHRNSFRCIMN